MTLSERLRTRAPENHKKYGRAIVIDYYEREREEAADTIDALEALLEQATKELERCRDALRAEVKITKCFRKKALEYEDAYRNNLSIDKTKS